MPVLHRRFACDDHSLGLFGYPALQAADILIYRAEYVPVGKDQQQHLKLCRSIAKRFNDRFGAYFPLPRPLFTATPKISSLADPTRKMSKSLGSRHYVGLFEEEAAVRRKVRSAVADSGDLPAGDALSPGVENLLEILSACGRDEVASQFRQEYRTGNRRYAVLKDVVADALVELTGRLRTSRTELMRDPDRVDREVRQMSERARELARSTLQDVRERVGLPRGLVASCRAQSPGPPRSVLLSSLFGA